MGCGNAEDIFFLYLFLWVKLDAQKNTWLCKITCKSREVLARETIPKNAKKEGICPLLNSDLEKKCIFFGHTFRLIGKKYTFFFKSDS